MEGVLTSEQQDLGADHDGLPPDAFIGQIREGDPFLLVEEVLLALSDYLSGLVFATENVDAVRSPTNCEVVLLALHFGQLNGFVGSGVVDVTGSGGFFVVGVDSPADKVLPFLQLDHSHPAPESQSHRHHFLFEHPLADVEFDNAGEVVVPKDDVLLVVAVVGVSFGEGSLVEGDLQGLSGHLVGVDVVYRDELVEAELVVLPLLVLQAVLLEVVLEITPEDVDQVVQLHSFLEQPLVLHRRVPDVGLVRQIHPDH